MASAPVLRLGRAQLWFGCILYFYSWTLTLMSLLSEEWVVSLGTINNASCPACPSYDRVHGKDSYQRGLLAGAIVMGGLGYLSLALRWLPRFERFPVLKLWSMGCLVGVVVLDVEAHSSYESSYQSSVVDVSGGSLLFGTGHAYAEIAAVYAGLALGLLLWHEGAEYHTRRLMRQRKQQRSRATLSNAQPSFPPPANSPRSLSMSSANGEQRAGSSPSINPPPHPTIPHSLPSGVGSSSRSAPSEPVLSRLGLYTPPDAVQDVIALKFSWKDQLSPMQCRLVMGANIFFLLLYCGGLIITTVEGWALSDGVNYILSAWCTLGYGLYTPITTGGRIFMYIYWPIGFAIISSTSTTLWRVFLFRVDRQLRETSEKLSRRRNLRGSQQLTGLGSMAAIEEDEKGTAEGYGRAVNSATFAQPELPIGSSRPSDPPESALQPQDERWRVQISPDQAHSAENGSPLTPSPRREGLSGPPRRQSRPPHLDFRRASLPPSSVLASYQLTSGHSLTVYETQKAAQPLSLKEVFAPLSADKDSTSGRTKEVEEVKEFPPDAPTTSVTPGLASVVPVLHHGNYPLAVSPPSPCPSTPLRSPLSAPASSLLTLPPSFLRKDFLDYLQQRTSREQLRQDIDRQRSHPIAEGIEEEEEGHLQEATAQPPFISHASPRPSSERAIANSAAMAQPSVSFHPFASSPLSANPSAALSPFRVHVGALLLKLAIAVAVVICWMCLAGGVFVWSESGVYGYWDCQWSAFNLLTTISIGSIATPFSTDTSAFFVWYLLLGVGTLAYCFALIAQIGFRVFDQSQAAFHRRRLHAVTEAQDEQENAFVSHAKELDRFILQLVQGPAMNAPGETEEAQGDRAIMNAPVLMLGRKGGDGQRVELPLEGVSLLLRYHLAFREFERARQEGIRRATERRDQRRRQRLSQRRMQSRDGTATSNVASKSAVLSAPLSGGAQPEEGAAGSAADESAEALDEKSDENEEELIHSDNGPTDRQFDWSNTGEWIAQVEEESEAGIATHQPDK